MPAKGRLRRAHALHLTWNRGLHLVSQVKPVDGFADVIWLRLSTDHQDWLLTFAHREHVLLLHEAVQALLHDTDWTSHPPPVSSGSPPCQTRITRVFTLG